MPRALFTFDDPASVTDWPAIDDRVMGGASQSRLVHEGGDLAVFTGVVSFANGGGFASVRSRPRDLAAPGAGSLVLDVCGDGKRYKLAVRTDDAWDGISWQAAFAPPTNVWTAVRLPLPAFQPTWRGRTLADAPPLDPARMRQLGLLIADRQAGAFVLQLRSIAAE
ncbi:MAG: CIA30 family protein [Burkholderiales bacterium]